MPEVIFRLEKGTVVNEALSNRALKIYNILSDEYPTPKTVLTYNNPLQLLIATILSAQCTDKRVNEVTKDLFEKYKNAREFAEADLKELEEAVRSTGFFRNKARSIKLCCQHIVEKYEGNMPATMEELVELPGVGRKTANVILGNAFGIPGIVVDTHVKRLSQRLGLTDNKDPDKIELELMQLLPEEKWTSFSHLLIYHGRQVCLARKPKCKSCSLIQICPSASI